MKYEEQDLIVCHLGSGISFAMHHHGRAIECSDALSGDGPFTPSRAGIISPVDIIHLCFSGKYNEKEMLRKINGHSGLTAHLGTNDVREVEKRIAEGDEQYVSEQLTKRLEFLAPVFIYPGEDELTALAHNAYRAMTGQQEIKEYK